VIDGQNVVVAGSGSGARMLNIQKSGDEYTYKEVWTNPKLGVTFNTPVLKDGFLYAGDARFGSLYCLNAKTGETAWADTVKLNRFASTLDLGSVMLNLSGSAQLTFFKPDPSALAILARYKVSETEIYAHPLVAGDKLYIKDKEKLTCWRVTGER
jgi:outer membrane protein assembly factor BamB